MPGISDLTYKQMPSSIRLFKATMIAIVVAIIILVVVVMPAEYGVDVTGLGKKLGLMKLANSPVVNVLIEENPEKQINSSIATKNIWISNEVFKEKTLTISLMPDQGAEIKAIMQQGQNFIYNWQASGKLYFDMHGEEFNAANNEFTSYWENESQDNASGSLIAPFSGTHGWYWQNKTSEPIKVELKISGFYKDVYLP